jgi:threonyl-tRNA synthetase
VEKVPYTLVLGGKEAEAGTASVRSRSRGDEGAVAFDAFLGRIQEEIRSRALSEKKKAAPAA